MTEAAAPDLKPRLNTIWRISNVAGVLVFTTDSEFDVQRSIVIDATNLVAGDRIENHPVVAVVHGGVIGQIMNIATGGGTLVHEIVHPYVEANFPGCPAWFNEGLGSLYEACGGEAPPMAPDVYLVAVGEGTRERAFALAEGLRDEVAGIQVETNLGGGSFKAQMKRADKSGATWALILGEQELSENRIGLKPLRHEAEQESIALAELATVLQDRLNGR